MSKISRRKLLGGSIKSIPLLALASSKSVWAASCNISGVISNNPSRVCPDTPSDSLTEDGNSPDFWEDNPQCWPKVVFPGLMVFSNKSDFNCKWDWTQYGDELSDYKVGRNSFYTWKKDLGVTDSHYGTYASSWRSLLGSYVPSFIDKDTVWESIKRDSGASDLEKHYAAAVLNACHDKVNYGYSIEKVVEYTNKAEAKNDYSIMQRFGEVIASMNSRNQLDSNLLKIYSSNDLELCSTYSSRDPWSNNYSYQKKRYSNFSNCMGSKSRYPSSLRG